MVVHNPNNWHWVEKNCIPWSKVYLEENIVNTEFENDDFKVLVDSIPSLDGDCIVSQRKGKVLCIYDMKLTFSVSGHSKSNDEKFSSLIIVPEFAHDADEDEYVFEIEAATYKPELKKYLVPLLREKLSKFQTDLIRAHEDDVKHSSN